MGEIFLLVVLSFIGTFFYRLFLIFYTEKRPQVVQIGEHFYLRTLSSPFEWKYYENYIKNSFSDKPEDLYYRNFITLSEKRRQERCGFATLKSALDFKDEIFINKIKKLKVKRIDGLFVFCKNKLSKIKLRRNKNEN